MNIHSFQLFRILNQRPIHTTTHVCNIMPIYQPCITCPYIVNDRSLTICRTPDVTFVSHHAFQCSLPKHFLSQRKPLARNASANKVIMLKRSRVSSPAPNSSILSDPPIYADDIPSAKRQRTTAPDAWDGESRKIRLKVRFEDSDSDENSEDNDDSQQTPESVTEPHNSSYLAVNSLLHGLNQERSLQGRYQYQSNKRRLEDLGEHLPHPGSPSTHRGQLPGPRSEEPNNATHSSTSSMYNYRHGHPDKSYNQHLRNSPRFDPEVEDEGFSTDSYSSQKNRLATPSVETVSAEECEAVRIRYEETNKCVLISSSLCYRLFPCRLLGSLVLSRLRSFPEIE